MVEAWLFAKKFGPYIVIVGLVIALLWFRNELTDKTAKLDAAEVRITDLEDANESLQTAIETVEQARVDNDAIAEAVAARLDGNRVREVHTREVIERAARNDPEVRNWVDTPLPDSVRRAIGTDSIDAGTP